MNVGQSRMMEATAHRLSCPSCLATPFAAIPKDKSKNELFVADPPRKKSFQQRPLYSSAAAEPLIILDTTVPGTMGIGDDDDGQASKDQGIVQSLRNYPKGVFFMLGNEFCERFSFYGMRAILIIYLTTDHKLSDNVAKEIYHAFVSLAYFSPLFGSILADNFFGRFRVILWVSLIYVFGHVLLSVGAIPQLGHMVRQYLDYAGLAVIAIATGGIKPCVSAFAADQFGDNQHRERTQFFSFFYFAINAGSLIAIAATPLLRTVKCFGSDHCFPLAFGVPGVLMLVAFVTFLFGWRFYKITPASKGNVIWKVVKCIGFAFRRKLAHTVCRKKHKGAVPEHWLDYATPKYDEHLIAGVKGMLAIVVLYIPVVLFWALFDQQGSTWVLQARRMDGRVGWITILPDQMNTINPALILLLVPIFEAWLYPCMNKLCKVTPLRKMAVGGILAALAFCLAGFLQIAVNDTMEPQPDPGKVFIQRMGNSSSTFEAHNNHSGLFLKGDRKTQLLIANYTFDGFDLRLDRSEPKSFVLGIFDLGDNQIEAYQFPYSSEKTDGGKTRFYFLVANSSAFIGTECFVLDDDGLAVSNATIANGAYIDIRPGFISTSDYYNITYGDCTLEQRERPRCQHNMMVHAQMGAAYALDLVSTGTGNPVQLVRPNSVSILWQIPQVFVITVGEILFSVTGLEFSYTQAAPSMKSVLQALWLLTVFFGNVIDIIISHAEIPDPVAEFFIYAGLMFAVIGIFIMLAMRYQYVDEHNLEIPESAEASRRSSADDKYLPAPQLIEKAKNGN